ncbi:alpha/beta-Hydrolases superfamily protein [Perilla frutescens var. hirtella]|uniref:Alpha/beta-Hydrolases superfamily protein n=1 Tax=Perilla frutescens var. hirtella TaxID=608512 RepID=A0AAD4IW65_PERFH|nr:alpha/beta-Hydrolases superfamily protein [Perilla frutescens var. hirtella]
MLTASAAVVPPVVGPKSAEKLRRQSFKISGSQFPAFLPKEMDSVKDPFARKLASRIERLPVDLSLSRTRVMSSCIKPKTQHDTSPLVLLHGFDSSCLEWRYALPLLEEAGFETWAVDVLGWGFSDLEKLPSCSVASKRDHLYQFWNSYIKRPMTLVGPSLGAAVAIDFVINHPEAVDKLILIDASVYAEGTGNLATLPKLMAYAGVYLLKSLPLRLFATLLAFNGVTWDTCYDWAKIGSLHCLLPWWADATVDFMTSGGYNISAQIEQVKQKTLIIWGENDQIIDFKLAVRLHSELPDAIIRQIPECGHIPHVEKPAAVSKLISEFVRAESKVCTVA